jgi:His/Glu/Gln/Arg/opine family amino acid ABC transporter permease subunit
MDFVKVFHEAMPLLLDGLKLTIGIALLAIALGMVIGFLSCIMGMSKNPVLRAISAVYVWLIRGTPMLVQAFFVFYAIPQLVKVMTGTAFTLTPFTAGAITLSLNAGAYISEIFRGGIMSIDYGQMEAARSLGLNYTQATWRVILPQTIKNVFPSLGNELIVLLKETSISGYIALQDLTKAGDIVRSRTYLPFFPYISVAAIYLVLVLILEKILGNIEGRMAASDR